MAKRTVVVEGGGANLYEVSETDGTYYVYKVSVGLLLDSRSSIGKARKLEDALAIIKSHSGRQIKEMR